MPLTPLITSNYTNARTYTHHRAVFQAAKWGYGLIFLNVCSVFPTNSQILARGDCQQGCAGWDKLRQVTDGGRGRNVCEMMGILCIPLGLQSQNRLYLCCQTVSADEVYVRLSFCVHVCEKERDGLMRGQVKLSDG